VSERRASALTAIVLGMGGCVGVLGLNDYGPIEDQLCVCPALESTMGAQRCRDRVQSSLAEEPAEAQAWLEQFDEKGCGSSCDEAHACFDHAPVCTPMDQVCETSTECCGSSGAEGAGCCAEASGSGRCCTSCVPCAAAVESNSPQTLCAGENDNNRPFAKCVCDKANDGVCTDVCQPACGDPIMMSKACVDCLKEQATDQNPEVPCSAQIQRCR